MNFHLPTGKLFFPDYVRSVIYPNIQYFRTSIWIKYPIHYFTNVFYFFIKFLYELKN